MSPPKRKRHGRTASEHEHEHPLLDFSAKPKVTEQVKQKLGVLAFGSLVKGPGSVLGAMVTHQIKVKTPFPVEYGRYSMTRGGAPTVVRHESGAPVSAEVMVLNPGITFDQARDALWNRARRKEGSGEKYREERTPNSVLIQKNMDCSGVECLLYVDFPEERKILRPSAKELAHRAAGSVIRTKYGTDGISYLAENIDAGIVTPMTTQYIYELQAVFGLDDFIHVRLLARSVGLARSVNDPVDISYDARLLHVSLASLALLSLGDGANNRTIDDWLDQLYGFLELTIGQSVHGKTQSALADVMKRGRGLPCDLSQLFHHLATAETSPGPAWAYVEAYVMQTLNQGSVSALPRLRRPGSGLSPSNSATRQT